MNFCAFIDNYKLSRTLHTIFVLLLYQIFSKGHFSRSSLLFSISFLCSKYFLLFTMLFALRTLISSCYFAYKSQHNYISILRCHDEFCEDNKFMLIYIFIKYFENIILSSLHSEINVNKLTSWSFSGRGRVRRDNTGKIYCFRSTI